MSEEYEKTIDERVKRIEAKQPELKEQGSVLTDWGTKLDPDEQIIFIRGIGGDAVMTCVTGSKDGVFSLTYDLLQKIAKRLDMDFNKLMISMLVADFELNNPVEVNGNKVQRVPPKEDKP